jgi:hypothetical protein
MEILTTPAIEALAAEPDTPATANRWIDYRRDRIVDLDVLDADAEPGELREYYDTVRFPAWVLDPPEDVSKRALADVLAALPAAVLADERTQLILRMKCHHLIECRIDVPACLQSVRVALRAAIAKAGGLPTPA